MGLRDIIYIHELPDFNPVFWVPLAGSMIHYAVRKVIDRDILMADIVSILKAAVAGDCVPAGYRMGLLNNAAVTESYNVHERDALYSIGINPVILKLDKGQQRETRWEPFLWGAQWTDANGVPQPMAGSGGGLTERFKAFTAPCLAQEAMAIQTPAPPRMAPAESSALFRAISAKKSAPGLITGIF